jgi:trigger factor
MEKKYTFTKEETKDKEIKLTIKVSAEEFMTVKNKMYNKLSKDVVITGFRPGKAPKNLIEARISGEIYDETINDILPKVTYEIITEGKFSPLTQVKYEVTKMSDAEGVEYTASFTNTPEIKLMDFKKIKVKKETAPLTDKEVEDEMDKIVKMYKPKDEKKDGKKDEDKKEVEEKVEITDELVKSLNVGFDTVEKLKEQVKKEMQTNKEYNNEQKYLNEIIEQAIKGSKIDSPKALIDEELHRREHEYTDQIEGVGLKIDDFLKSQNKTMDDLKKEWESDAKRRIDEELLFYQVIKENKIVVSKEEVEAEIANIQNEATKKQMDSDSGRRYVGSIILQQKAMNHIKSQISE